MSDSTVEDWEDWEDTLNDFPDDSNDKTEPEPEPEPEKICIEDKSTKNMENNEMDEIFSSMADVFRDKHKTFGLPENFSLETESDFKILGEFISSMVQDNSKDTRKDTSKNRNVYTFIRTILDNTIDKLNHAELTECQGSFSVELNNRNRKQKSKSKPKKKKASLRMDRADRDNTIYNDNFEDF